MNLTLNIFLVIFSFGVIQGIILSILIIFKKNQKLFNYYFGAFLLLLSLASAKIILQETVPGFLNKFHLPLLYKFAFGPLLYIFVKELLFRNTKSFSANFIHFIPTIVFDILFRIAVPVLGFQNSDYQVQLFNLYVLNIGSLIYNLGYWFLALQLLLRYKSEKKNGFQIIEKRIAYYLKRILAFDFLASISTLAFLLLTIYYGKYDFDGFQSYYINYIVITLYIYYLSYIVYIFPEIELISPNFTSTDGKKDSNPIRLVELKNEIVNKKYFTDPDINLNKISEQLNISPRELSRIINTEAEMNFNDFLNEIRIEYFKKLLDEDKFSIEGMAYEAGFKSKTSFYRAFKKSTGQTPSQYQKCQKRVPNSEFGTLKAP